MPTPPAGSPRGLPSVVMSPDLKTRELPSEERDLDKLGSAVPDSQQYVSKHFESSPAKRFSAVKDEISETVLGEGFAFGVKRPPRPGQFSERPCRQPSEANKQTQISPRINKSQEHSVSSRRQAGMPVAIPRGPPLPLHELSLPGSQLISTPPPRQNCHPSKSPEAESSETHHAVVQVSSHQPSNKLPSKIYESRGLGLPAAADSIHEHQKEASVGLLHDPFRDSATEGPISKTQPSKGLRDMTATITGRHSTAQDNATHTEKDNVLVENFHREPCLPGLSISEKHLLRTDHNRRRSSPTSTCGDLEGPVHRSPRRPRDSMANHQAVSRPSSHRDGVVRYRSQSRASNITRKRSTIRKHRPGTGPERKKMAMHQVAQYWNECLQISEEENIQANSEIERLQNDLQRQQSKLSESRSMLDQKQRELQDIERRCHQLQEKNSQVSSENTRLSNEIETLRGHLSESKTRAAVLEDKHRQYRLKLNEAIKEQQTLFLSSRTFYEQSMSELRKENEKRITDSSLVDKALDDSRQKRQEMKRCLEEFRDQMEREDKLKEQTISELRSKVKEQEDSLRHERDLTESLRRQVEMQEHTQNTVVGVASKMESLLESWAKKEQEQKENAKFMTHIHQRLDALTQHVLTAKADTPSPATFEHVVQSMDDIISTRVTSAAANIASCQHRVEQTVLSLGVAFGAELGDIRRVLSDQDDRYAASEAIAEEANRKLQNCFEKLGGHMQTTQAAYQQIKQILEARVESETQSQEASITQRQASLEEKLAERGERIHHLEQQFQLISEAYKARSAACRDDTDPKKLQNLFIELQSSLDEGFRHEKERSEGNLRQNQTTMAALAGQLKLVNDHLAMAKLSASQENNVGRNNVEEDQSLSSHLRKQIQDLESQAKATEELRDRWQRDIQTVDALRCQLKNIQQRIPEMERLGSALDSMTEVNQILHSTSQYLVQEGRWARQHTEPAIQTDGGRNDCAKPGIEVQSEATQQPTVSQAVTDLGASSVRYDKSASLQKADEDSVDNPVNDASMRRRVTVHSPAGYVNSPSPPPSVEQEQMRRREAAQPRSILKLSASSLQESGSLEEQTVRMTLHQSQYNRPVMGRISNPMASAEMVEEIRSGLVPNKQQGLSWNFPTVAEFERDSQIASANNSRRCHGSGKRRQQGPDDASEADKKRKLDASSSVPGSMTQTAEDTCRQAPSGEVEREMPRRPVRWTYSRTADN